MPENRKSGFVQGFCSSALVRQLGTQCYFIPFLRQCVITQVFTATLLYFLEAFQVFSCSLWNVFQFEVHPVHKRS
ncbi:MULTISPECIES: hypothetical protein [Paenibacillus]|uniref:Uncharacterized protein n=1 Tax=Paenibacillus brasilensis TaxID=128574 RepID=A0ABU0KRI9_9BACL|nr:MULTISPECIES: hypothetical protein [Paenibacillus]MDQ0492046.1 hypothetical protein [Paenibacillus brasilensis]